MTSDALTQWVTHWGYPALFLGTFAEGTGLPGPVEVLFLAAGFMVARGRLLLTAVIVVSTVGNLIGNFVGYAVGLYGGRPFVERYGRYLGIQRRGLGTAQLWFDRYGGLAVAVSRIIGITRTPAIVAAGVLRLNPISYGAWSLAGDLVFAAFWALVGTYFGHQWSVWQSQHPLVMYVAAAFIVVAMVAGAIGSKRFLDRLTSEGPKSEGHS